MGISVLMSVYAKEKPEYFKEALESVINQTLQPDEILIMKDGPLTEELEVVITEVKEQLEAEEITLRTHQFLKNVQLGRALEKGVELCEHEFIARMDTDDIACPDRLQKQYEYLQKHKDIVVLGGYMEEFCEDTDFTQIKTMPIGSDDLKRYAKYRNPLNHMTVMFRKSAIMETGNYRHYPLLEDYELWIRVLAMGYRINNLPEVLVRARVGKELYGRRGGFDYCKRYLRLRDEQYDLKLISRSEWMLACILTIGITIVPSGARKKIYQKLLRK